MRRLRPIISRRYDTTTAVEVVSDTGTTNGRFQEAFTQINDRCAVRQSSMQRLFFFCTLLSLAFATCQYGVAHPYFGDDACSCYPGFSGTNCTVRPSSLCPYRPVSSVNSAFDAQLSTYSSPSGLSVDILASLEQTPYLFPSSNDTLAGNDTAYVADTTITFDSVATPCDYPGPLWSALSPNNNCNDHLAGQLDWQNLLNTCGFVRNGAGAYNGSLTATRTYSIPTSFGPMGRVESASVPIYITFPLTATASTDVQVQDNVVVVANTTVFSVSVLSKVAFDPITFKWNIAITTITAAPYQLNLLTPTTNDNGRTVSAGLSACNIVNGNCVQTASFYAPNCAALNVIINLSFNATCRADNANCTQPTSSNVNAAVTVTSGSSCPIATTISFSGATLFASNRSDLAYQTKIFGTRDTGYFGANLYSSQAKINSLTPVQVCYKYNYTGSSYSVTSCPSNAGTPHPNTEVDYTPSTMSSNSYFGFYSSMSGDGLWSAGSSFVLDKVYIYSHANKASPVLTQVINAVGTANGRFGGSIGFSQNGNILVVGAPLQGGATYDGRAYIFSRSGPSQNYTLVTSLAPPACDRCYFGWSSVVSGDGSTVIISAPNSDAGANKISRVFFYTAASSWALQKTLTYNNITFGSSLAVNYDGSAMVAGVQDYSSSSQYVSTGTVYLAFKSTNWAPVKLPDQPPMINCALGLTVAMSNDAKTIAASGQFQCNYIFTNINGTWTYSQVRRNSRFGQFGMSADGLTTVLGAESEGGAYLIKQWAAGSFSTELITGPSFVTGLSEGGTGNTLTLSSSGSTLSLGTYGAASPGLTYVGKMSYISIQCGPSGAVCATDSDCCGSGLSCNSGICTNTTSCTTTQVNVMATSDCLPLNWTTSSTPAGYLTGFIVPWAQNPAVYNKGPVTVYATLKINWDGVSKKRSSNEALITAGSVVSFTESPVQNDSPAPTPVPLTTHEESGRIVGAGAVHFLGVAVAIVCALFA
ncbi:hypothetical protein PROFUN_03297 [Planoprotostelium fungivorum]|uniref:EGF-like domain-containing protein n=1 Tax=Planoprotostelium fungivorum TaxID=1890364 RepID=A0A2P6NWP9_9EUKA|nr:hypothetical protein PROFUN_03297 [Planoprotostelium fungivorum]